MISQEGVSIVDSRQGKMAELYRLLEDIRYSSESKGIRTEIDTIMTYLERQFENEFPNMNLEKKKVNPYNAGRKKRFSFEESLEIINEYKKGTCTMKQLAKTYHCSQSTIHAIVGDSRYISVHKPAYYEFDK